MCMAPETNIYAIYKTKEKKIKKKMEAQKQRPNHQLRQLPPSLHLFLYLFLFGFVDGVNICLRRHAHFIVQCQKSCQLPSSLGSLINVLQPLMKANKLYDCRIKSPHIHGAAQ